MLKNKNKTWYLWILAIQFIFFMLKITDFLILSWPWTFFPIIAAVLFEIIFTVFVLAFMPPTANGQELLEEKKMNKKKSSKIDLIIIAVLILLILFGFSYKAQSQQKIMYPDSLGLRNSYINDDLTLTQKIPDSVPKTIYEIPAKSFYILRNGFLMDSISLDSLNKNYLEQAYNGSASYNNYSFPDFCDSIIYYQTNWDSAFFVQQSFANCSSSIMLGFKYSDPDSVTSVVIEGDTMSAIVGMFKAYDRLLNEFMAASNIIEYLGVYNHKLKHSINPADKKQFERAVKEYLDLLKKHSSQ